MKNFLTILFAFITGVSAAQRVSVSPSVEEIGDEMNPSYKLFIPYADEKKVTSKWVSFLKDYRAKVKSSKGEVNATNAVLPLITKDTFQVYSRIVPDDKGTTILAAFESGTGYVNATDYPAESESILSLLKNFGLTIAKEAHKEKVEEAEKVVYKQQKENEELTKRNERLKNDNEKMRNQINDNEREFSDNEKKMKKLEEDLSTSRSSLDSIKSKSAELE